MNKPLRFCLTSLFVVTAMSSHAETLQLSFASDGDPLFEYTGVLKAESLRLSSVPHVEIRENIDPFEEIQIRINKMNPVTETESEANEQSSNRAWNIQADLIRVSEFKEYSTGLEPVTTQTLIQRTVEISDTPSIVDFSMQGTQYQFSVQITD